MLTVCASSTDDLLTTKQRFRDYLGSTSTSTADGVEDRLILAASKAVATYLGYPPLRQLYQETAPAYGGQELMLSRTPILNVERVFSGTDTGTDTEILSSEYRVEDAEAGLLGRDVGWPWTAQPYLGFLESERRPGQELRHYLVEYAAGFVFTQSTADGYGSTSTGYGTTSTGRTLPEDIELAVQMTAKEHWLSRKRDPGIESKSVGDLSINYRSEGLDSASGVPVAAARLLRPYVRQF